MEATNMIGIGPPIDERELFQYVIYRCVVGSRAYGLGGEDSDYDRRGIYLPPTELHLSLAGVPEQLENKATDECYWEIEKFLRLALKANPNVLECLYTPLVEEATPLARELLAMRAAFLSRAIYTTYKGYADSQFAKIAQDVRTRGAVRWKHPMHLIRLLLCGIGALRAGWIVVDVGEYRERLLAIGRGEMLWSDVEAWRTQLREEIEAAYRATTLPEHPDYDAANAFLLKARRSMM